jgi:alginate biosynthesis protein Alg44
MKKMTHPTPQFGPTPAQPVDTQGNQGMNQPEKEVAHNPVPQDFVYDTEHPVLPVPFKAMITGQAFEGVGLSVTAAYVAVAGVFDPEWLGRKAISKLEFQFRGFTILLDVEVIVAGSRESGEMTLQFVDPLGEHLPQLRYILNTFIAGDFVSMNGMLGFSGPVKLKEDTNAAAEDTKRHYRSIAMATLSAFLILIAGSVLFGRATQSYELRPVFIERAGSEMKATTAGQVSYLNPDAKQGDVVFSIYSNSGDVLNFQLPCDCEVVFAEGIFEGATVLQIDTILSFFEPTVKPTVKTQMSLEGLTKAMNGDKVFLDMNDGQTIPVNVVVTSATNTASLRGDLFVPVTLIPTEGALANSDIGKSARVRFSKTLFGSAIPSISDIL